MHDMNKLPEKTIPLQIRDFPADVAGRMRAFAKLRDCSVREVVVAALEDYLPQELKDDVLKGDRQVVEVER